MINCIVAARYEIHGFDEEDFFDDEGIDPEQVGEQAYALARKGGVRILSDKDPNAFVLDKDREVIGALFTSWQGGEFSFDVAVSRAHQGRHIGAQLIEYAIDTFNDSSEAYGDDAKMEIDVINRRLVRHLEKQGFTVIKKQGAHTLMRYTS